MSFLNNIKGNKPVVGLEGYFITILAKSKFGKTTFVYDLVKEYYNGDLSKALLLAPEIGYKTLEGIHAIPIADYDMTTDDEKEELNQFGFIETIDELIENKADIPYRMVIIDTITALERLATPYMLQQESRRASKNGNAVRYQAIGDIPYGGGYNALAEVLYEQIDRLKKAGFATIIIGHEKIKQVKPKEGDEYNLVTLNCQGKTTDIIEREADLIIYGDLIKNEKGEERMLRFRSDGNIICGSRFRTMPDAIEFDVKLFLDTFKQAVLDSFDGNKEKMEEADKEQHEESEKKSDAFVKNEQEKAKFKTMESKEIIEYIDKFIEENKDKQEEVKEIIKEHNNKKVNYRTIKGVEKLRKIALAIYEL